MNSKKTFIGVAVVVAVALVAIFALADFPPSENAAGTIGGVEAADRYKADQDVLAQFFDERCVFKTQAQVTAKAFYSTYEQWCSDNGERAKSQMWLWPKLEERGVMKDKTRMGFTYRGIGLMDINHV